MDCRDFPEMSLHSETRWSREYRSEDGSFRHFESRFLDGTATVALGELEAQWPGWSEHERLDFCHAFACGADVPDRDRILRFLIKDADDYVSSALALNVAVWLPMAEAVPVLKQWCLTGEMGRCSNYFQALTLTKAPDALEFLRGCFARVWNTPGLGEDADFCNWIAEEAMWCIKAMLELGENRDTLREAYEAHKTPSLQGQS